MFNYWDGFFKQKKVSFSSPFLFSSLRHHCWSLSRQPESEVEAVSGDGRARRWEDPGSPMKEELLQPYATHLWTIFTWGRNRLLFFLILFSPLLVWIVYYWELNWVLTGTKYRIILRKINPVDISKEIILHLYINSGRIDFLTVLSSYSGTHSVLSFIHVFFYVTISI